MAQRNQFLSTVSALPRQLQRDPLLLILVLLLLFVLVLPAVLLLNGVGVLRHNGTPVVVNEVYLASSAEQAAPVQWIELYNTTAQDLPLGGWQLNSAQAPLLTLPEVSIAGQGYLVLANDVERFRRAFPGVVVPVIGGFATVLDLRADGLQLLDRDGQLIEELFWGIPDANWMHQPAQWKAGREPLNGRPGFSLVRKSLGVDTDQASDFRANGEPTPGRLGLSGLDTTSYWLLFDFTNYLSLIGGFVLWFAYAMIGLVARRFERLTNQRSYWEFLLVAPVGIVIYNVIQARAFFERGFMTTCTENNRFTLQSVILFDRCEQGYAFVALLISALITLLIVYRFFALTRRILEA